MKRLLFPLLLLCVGVANFNCQKEISFTGTTTNNDPVTAILQGNIVDENNNPAQGVTITVGAKTAVTDVKGYFRIRNASLDKSATLVTAEKTGYFKAFRVFSATNAVNHIKIKLLKKILTGSVNAGAGGLVTLSNGSSIQFTANSFSKASGGSYSGTVNVYAAFIDPTANDIGETIPGSLLANNKDNKRVMLTSYGMMAVELESPAGEKLQITSGSTAKLAFSIPSAAQASAPSSIPLWFVDEKTGLWTEEGTATKNGNAYEGDVKHFTYWNCDVPNTSTVNLTAKFVDQNGYPLVYADVWFTIPGVWGGAHGFTDSLGRINGPVPANVNLVMKVNGPYPCYSVIYTQNVGPFASNVDLGTIAVNNTQNVLSIQGKLLKCDGSPVTNGFATIQYDNVVRYASVNGTGNYALSFVTCGNVNTTCTVIGTDSQNGQQSIPMTATVNLPVTTVPDISACGTSTVEFVSYTLDGIPVNLSSTIASDQFYESDTLGSNTITLRGYRSGSENLTISYTSNGAAGTFAIDFLQVGGYFFTSIIAPFNIVITNHPAVGGYFEGSYSGQFKDQANVTHSLSGTLRIRRR